MGAVASDGQFMNVDRYRRLFDDAPIGIVNVDLSGRPLMVNRRAALSFGYATPEEFIENVPSIADLWVDPSARERAAEIMLKHGTLEDFEVAMRRRDGSHMTISVSASPYRDDDGEVVGIQVSGIDVTSRVEAEQRLEDAQSQVSIGFWSWRLDTGEIVRTKGVAAICGDDLEDRMFSELVHPDDRDMFQMKLATFMRLPGEGFSNEFRIVTPAGETRWVVATGRVDVDGVRVSGSLQDITRQKQVETRLTELNEMKTEFVSVVAHDLRHPLTVAAGYTEFLGDQWDQIADGERRELVDRVKGSLERLGSLVADVLEVTRLESGTATFESQPFDLAELVKTAAAEAASIPPHPVCDVSIPSPIPRALADRERIWRVLSNLLSNAAKYSPPGEAISVEVLDRVHVLQVSVRDRGPGIAAADQPKLFQKFSRVAPHGGPRPPGTGLGLFICRSLVEASGGSIWVESSPGHGSTFSFTVPIAAPAEVETEARAADPVSRAS